MSLWPENFVQQHSAARDSAHVAAPSLTLPVSVPGRVGRWRFARSLAIVLLATSVGACSSFDFFNKNDVAPDEPADRLYNEGLFLLNQKHDPKQAAKKFEEVDRQHPYSEWARKSLIMASYS
jgi:hypothetical protein